MLEVEQVEGFGDVGDEGLQNQVDVTGLGFGRKFNSGLENSIGLIDRGIGDEGVELDYEGLVSDIRVWRERISSLERDIESLWAKDELYWKQRSKMESMAAGDRNLRFFHMRASAKRKEKTSL
ncbi:hypothetical protein ACOSQ2_014581 [Xanthoceras sorbifolium]